jgi:hypothetical protein
MERCVYKYVYNFLLLNNIITSNQSGFTFGDSAINQLVNISNDFGRALDSGKEIRVVFCDCLAVKNYKHTYKRSAPYI